jgi:hypothetical protein
MRSPGPGGPPWSREHHGFVEVALEPPADDGYTGAACGGRPPAAPTRAHRDSAPFGASEAPDGGTPTARAHAHGPAAALSLDDALAAHVGELGAGQVVTLLAASVSWVTLACAALAMVFFSADPVRARAWRCADLADAECMVAFAAAPRDGAPFCRLRPEQYAFEPPRLSAVSEFRTVCGEAWRAAVANSAYFVGIWAGSTPFG